MKTYPSFFGNIFHKCQQLYKSVVNGIQSCVKKVKETFVAFGNAVTSVFHHCFDFFSTGKKTHSDSSASHGFNPNDNWIKPNPVQIAQTDTINSTPTNALALIPKTITPVKPNFHFSFIPDVRKLLAAPVRSPLQVILDKKAEEQKLAIIPYEPNIFLKKLDTNAAKDVIQNNSSQKSIMQTLKQESDVKVKVEDKKTKDNDVEIFYDCKEFDDASEINEALDNLSESNEAFDNASESNEAFDNTSEIDDDDEEYFDCESTLDDEIVSQAEDAAITNTLRR